MYKKFAEFLKFSFSSTFLAKDSWDVFDLVLVVFLYQDMVTTRFDF
jgi:hypothetical protein